MRSAGDACIGGKPPEPKSGTEKQPSQPFIAQLKRSNPNAQDTAEQHPGNCVSSDAPSGQSQKTDLRSVGARSTAHKYAGHPVVKCGLNKRGGVWRPG